MKSKIRESFFAEIETPCRSFGCFDYIFWGEKSANDVLQHCIVVSNEICSADQMKTENQFFS